MSTISAALIQSPAVLPANETLRNSKRTSKYFVQKPVRWRVLPTVSEIHRTSRHSLNLVPNFFSPKHTRLDEFELQHQDVLTVALELHSEALLAVTGLLDRVLSVDVDFPRVRES